MRVGGKDVPLFPHLLAVFGGFLFTCIALFFSLYLSGMFDDEARGIGPIGTTAFASAHVLIGAVFGFISPEKGWRWGVWLCAVPVCFTSIFGREAYIFLWVVALTLAPSCAGAYVASRVHLRYTRVI
jgi:hypothetical protein